MKNITLSIPDELLQKSREYAKRHGTSLNELVRKLLRQVVLPPEKNPTQKLIEHIQNGRVSVDTKGNQWIRAEIYDRKVFS